MIQIADTTIRKATMDDAAEIANVHLNSWREAYRNLLPQGFLDQLPLTFKRRMNMWKHSSPKSCCLPDLTEIGFQCEMRQLT